MKNIYALCGVLVSVLALMSGDVSAATAKKTTKTPHNA